MATLEKVRVEPFLDGQGLHVILDSPKGNVLDGPMMGSINSLLDDLHARHELKLVCFSGEGKHFSFGASVPDHVRELAPRMLELFHGMFYRLADLGIITAAAVRGRCLGGGMELACFCHRIIASPDAVFGQPEIQLAVLPPVASLILPHRVNQARADDIVLTGRNVDAPEALAIGLVDGIADDPRAEIEAWAGSQLPAKSAAALRVAVRASRWQFNNMIRAELPRIERLYLDELMATHDANEGLAAFLEKRTPAYRNQ